MGKQKNVHTKISKYFFSGNIKCLPQVKEQIKIKSRNNDTRPKSQEQPKIPFNEKFYLSVPST